jgi:hypothetical protein
MANEETRPILCGRCHVGVKQRTDPNGQEMAFCPSCGETDTTENVIREASEYFTNETARKLMGPLEHMRSTEFMKVTITRPPQRTYRFILG